MRLSPEVNGGGMFLKDVQNAEKEKLVVIRDMIVNSFVFQGINMVGITGSIGRREKSILASDLNDVDCFVIAESRNDTRKKELEKELCRFTNTVFTDVFFLNAFKFQRILKKRIIEQSLYDLIKGHLILYTDGKFFDLFEKHINEQYIVSRRSAIEVMLARLWCLTGPYRVEDNKIVPIDSKFTLYQVKKAFGAIIDAVLICEGAYFSPGPGDKVKNFRNTKFYEKHEKSGLNILMDVYSGGGMREFSVIHDSLVNLYLLTMKDVLKIRCSSCLIFSLKKRLLLSFFRKGERYYIKSIMRRFRTLRMIKSFYDGNESEKDLLERLKVRFEQIYSEVMG